MQSPQITVTVNLPNDNYDPEEWLDVYRREKNPYFDPEKNKDVQKLVEYVTVYAVTREYGGSEEGGWWYNCLNPVCSIPLIEPGDASEIETIKEFLRPRFQNSGNIYRVNGGTLYEYYNEYDPGENRTANKPTYE